MKLRVGGDLIDKTVDYDTTVTPTPPLYVYKQWTNFNGVHWMRRDEFRVLSLTLTMPEYDNPNPGVRHLVIEKKNRSD